MLVALSLHIAATLSIAAQKPDATDYDTTIGSVYYVSPSGNDLNPGTSPVAAWQTISRVNAVQFQPGDRILFEGGQGFTGSILLNSANAGIDGPTAPIIISSYGNDRATIDAGVNQGFYAHNTAGIELRNLNFRGSGMTTNTQAGVGFYTDLQDDTQLEHIVIDQVDISNFGDVGLYLGSDGSAKSGFKNVAVIRTNIHDNYRDGMFTWGGGPYPRTPGEFGHEHFYIGHSKFYNNPGRPGHRGEGNGVYLKDIDSGTIEYSEAYNNGANAWGGVGIWALQSNNITIQHNESHHNRSNNYDGSGFDLDGGVSNSRLQYNYSHDNDGPGFELVQFDGALPYTNNVVRYNISENDKRKSVGHGVLALWSEPAGALSDTYIYNNTIYVAPSPEGTPEAVGIETEVTNVRIFNNIFIVRNGEQAIVKSVPSSPGVSFHSNNYWSQDADITIEWGANTYHSIETWSGDVAQEMGAFVSMGLAVDPNLTAPGQGGTIGNPDQLASLTAYKLRAESPLIDGGINPFATFGVNPGARDFYGTGLPVGADYDVGAHEYGGSIPSRVSIQPHHRHYAG
jgi:hypothetical protein